METVVRLEDWFSGRLQGLRVSRDARAYLVSLFSSMRTARDDLSKDSIVLRFADAREKQDFASFQRIGDWTVFSLAAAPESLKERQLVVDLARISYYSCWRMTRGSWVVYEELADELPRIGHDVRALAFRLPRLDVFQAQPM